MRKNQDVAIIFSQALRIGLLAKFRHIPSSGFLAKEFNLRANNTNTITSETARRWLQGQVLPDIDKMISLSEWLGIDLNTLLSIKKASENKELDLANKKIQEFIGRSETLISSLHDITQELEMLINRIKKNSDT